jgi:glycosyltransferase involved in cell wall biosynthesis
MEISVIIPVYNKESYIKGCIRNILSQDFDSFEIILVDDGSNDCSGIICDEIAAKENKLHVFHTPNGGVTAARKYGLEHSNGNFIMFVDADDILLPNGLKVTYEAIKRTNADEIIGTYKTQYGTNITSGYDGYEENELLIKDLLGSKLHFCLLWGILYKRELLSGCMDTPREIIEGEDIMMQIKCLMKSPKVYFIQDCIYQYNIGIPNKRNVGLGMAITYDKILKESLSTKWDTFHSYYVLHKIKVYEDFIERKQFYVFDKYYKSLRNEIDNSISIPNRIIVMLNPRISRYIIIAYRWFNKIRRKGIL